MLRGNPGNVIFQGDCGKPRANTFIQKEEVKTMYEDKTLVCKECGKEFIFSAGEQEFYAEKGFENEPTRCKDCRAARKAALRQSREMHTAQEVCMVASLPRRNN